MLSTHIHDQLFTAPPPPVKEELIRLAKEHLTTHELLGKTGAASPPIAFNLPPLQGKTLDEHFYKLGSEASQLHLEFAE